MGTKNNAVLPFEQTGAFYHKRAVIKADRQSYLEAVGFLRKALEREPNNPEYMLDLADVFARMNCYNESNRVLVSIVRLGGATPECFFGMGCNFYALRQYARARESFLTYQQLEPDGEFAEAVEELLEELDEVFFEEPPHLSLTAQKGGQALDDGDYNLAVRLLRRAVKREPDLAYLRNNLALALFCAGDVDRAARETAVVLAEEPKNLHANCNMAIILNSRGKRAQAQVHVDRALEGALEDIEYLTKVCLMLCELGRDEDAYFHLKKLLNARPYDRSALHYFAVACFNLGKDKEAIAAWDRARRIDPHSPVPPYCIAKARAAMQGEDRRRMDYHDQLPAQEVQRRVAEFASNLGGSREEFILRFEQDEGFRELVRWGLSVTDPAFRRTALKLLTFVGGQQAEEMLRDFLMRPDEGEEIKREVMSCLSEIGAKEPYMAILGGTVVEVRISVFSSDRAMTDAQRQVIQMAIEGVPFPEEATRAERDKVVREIIDLWASYLGAQGARGRRIRKPQNWAAALLTLYLRRSGATADIDALCAHFEMTQRTLKQYARTLLEALEGGDWPQK